MSQPASLKLSLVAADQSLAMEVRESLPSPDVQLLFERPASVGTDELRAAIQRLRPDVLLLDARFASLAQGSTDFPGAPDVVAIHTAADPDLILAAMRAGIREFVYPPFADRLPEALARVRQSRSDASGCAGHMIAFAGAKGGCGTTTVSCHAAAELARSSGQKVLLADLDIDGGAVGFLMNSTSPYSLSDAIDNTARLDPSYWKALVSNGYPNLEVIQSPPLGLGRASAPEQQMREVLRFMRVQYSWTVLDTGRRAGSAVWSALEPGDTIFLVATVDLVALHHARQMVQALRDNGIGSDRVRLVLNAIPKNPLVTPHEIEATLGIELYAVLGDDAEALAEAHSSRKLAGAATNFGRQIARLASKLTGQPEAAPKRRFSLFFKDTSA